MEANIEASIEPSTKASIEPSTKASTEDRLGRVFTPIPLIHEIYQHLAPYLCPHMRIYEPGVGDLRFRTHYPLPCVYEGCDIEPIPKMCQNIDPKMCQNIDPKIDPIIDPSIGQGIVQGDFFDQPLTEYDLIVGNPPFRVETTGPSSSPIKTKPKQKTLWADMVHRCFKHLKPDGILAMILPCIWMKPDKAGIYDLFTQHRILRIKCFSCAESNKLFGYKGQTPVCYVIVQNATPLPAFELWDSNGFVSFSLRPGHCIPTRNARLLQYSRSLFTRSLEPIKIATETRTDLIPNPQENPVLYTYRQGNVYGVENGTGVYRVPKVMLLHKSKPFPILDLEGRYAVGGRDKYVFTQDPPKMFAFLSQPIVQNILTCFVIRMNFYEKYTFDYLPCLEESDAWLQRMT